MAADKHIRVVIDCIDLLAATTSTKPDSGAFLADLSILEISDKNVLEFSNGIVVFLNQVWRISDTAADVDRSGWIGYLHRLEDGPNALVGLKLLRNALDHECASIERVHVLGRTEPVAAHANHGTPVDVDESEDDKGDDISHDHMSPEPDAANISDCEKEENVLGRFLGYLGVVINVDGD